jgi:type IV pilus assembly protein PilV
MKTRSEAGMMLIEALIALLVFSLGILGMVAMGGSAIGAQSDARYRTDAARFADDIASRMAVGVDRASVATLEASLSAYGHQPGGSNCAFSGTASTETAVQDWVKDVRGQTTGVRGLPSTTAATQQIAVSPAGAFNRVAITVCWQGPSDAAWRHHTLVTYVN